MGTTKLGMGNKAEKEEMETIDARGILSYSLGCTVARKAISIGIHEPLPLPMRMRY